MKKAGFLVAVAGAMLLVGAGCSSLPGEKQVTTGSYLPSREESGPIKVGWLGPLTGDAASVGQDTLKGAQLAVDEINAAGGVGGRKLELVVEDGKCNPKDAAQAGNKLINVDKVPVIFGGLCSGETTAVAPVAEQNKVLLISGCSSAPSITTAGEYVFRSYPSDLHQGKFAAEYVYNKLGKKKVATLAVLGDYGTGIKNAFEAAFKQLGGEIVLSQDYAQDARDLKAQLTKVKGSGAELLYFVGYTEASIAGLKQAKELGLNLPMLGGDAWDDSKIHANSFAEGMMYTVYSANTSDAWKAKLKDKGGNPTVCVPRTYDNVKLVSSLMKQAGPDATKLKDALYGVKDYPGEAGPITFDGNGDPTFAQYDVKVVKYGKAEVMK